MARMIRASIRAAKTLLYSAASLSGVNAVLIGSAWRRAKLLVLCYHGVSLDDEHEWSDLYLPPELLRERLERVREAGCNVLPLGPAIKMLYEGNLPAKSVALTFDDGFFDFYAKAYPLLQRFGFPSTVYFATYYSCHNVPVFTPMVGYLLWKGRKNLLSWDELGFSGNVLDETGRPAAERQIIAFSTQKCFTGPQRNDLLRTLAERLNVDLDELNRRRILHVMTPLEAAELLAAGVDLQLHTHSHRVYRARDAFMNELKENQDAIEGFGAPTPEHFCYPGGLFFPESEHFLEEYGIRSATTCELGLATPKCSRFRLPRFLDSQRISADEFSAWLSGFADAIPRKGRWIDWTRMYTG